MASHNVNYLGAAVVNHLLVVTVEDTDLAWEYFWSATRDGYLAHSHKRGLVNIPDGQKYTLAHLNTILLASDTWPHGYIMPTKIVTPDGASQHRCYITLVRAYQLMREYCPGFAIAGPPLEPHPAPSKAA